MVLPTLRINDTPFQRREYGKRHLWRFLLQLLWPRELHHGLRIQTPPPTIDFQTSQKAKAQGAWSGGYQIQSG